VSSDLALAARPHGTPERLPRFVARGVFASFLAGSALANTEPAQARAPNLRSRQPGPSCARRPRAADPHLLAHRNAQGKGPGTRANRVNSPALARRRASPNELSRPSHETLGRRTGRPVSRPTDTGRLQRFPGPASATRADACLGSLSPRKATPPSGSQENVPITSHPWPDGNAAPRADKVLRIERTVDPVSVLVERRPFMTLQHRG